MIVVIVIIKYEYKVIILKLAFILPIFNFFNFYIFIHKEKSNKSFFRTLEIVYRSKT